MFNSIGHVFAWFFHKVVEPLVTHPQQVEQVITEGATLAGDLLIAIEGPKNTKAPQYVRDLAAIGGDVVNAFMKASEAIGAEGLNVQFDLATIDAIKRLTSDVKSAFHPGKSVPVTPPPPAVSPQQ